MAMLRARPAAAIALGGDNCVIDRSPEPVVISVVIPVRDRVRTLGLALESVRRQTVPVHEILVVDDGSTDGSPEVAREYGATVLVHESSRGSGAARNTGIQAANGTWIAFLDSDDQWMPEHVETFLGRVGDEVLVSTRAVDSLGKRRGYLGSAVAHLDPSRCFVPEPPVVTSGCFVRKDALVAAGLFRGFPRAQDLDMWARVLEHGAGIALPVTTVAYTVTEQGLAEESRQRNIQHVREVAASFADRAWTNRRFYRAIETRIHWDAFRRGLSRRDRAVVVRNLGWLVARPAAWSDVVRLVVSRRGVEWRQRVPRSSGAA